MSIKQQGPFLADTEDVPVKELTQWIRSTIRQAAKQRLINPEWKYSVRYTTAARYEGIEVRVTVPQEVIELRREFEQFLWETGDHPSYLDYPEKMIHEFEPLRELRSTEILVREIHDSYNFIDIPDNPWEDGCARRYWGSVSVDCEA